MPDWRDLIVDGKTVVVPPLRAVPSASTPSEDEETANYLLECVNWCADVFIGPGLGGRHIDLVLVGSPQRTVIEDGRRLVLFSPGSNDHQLRHQAGHEAFHAIWSKPVFHWTHEMLACLSAYLRDRERDPRYAAISVAAARRGAPALALTDVPLVVLDDMTRPVTAGFYERVTLVGIALHEATGLGPLATLAQGVAARDGHDRDDYVREWVSGTDLPDAVAQDIALLLSGATPRP